MKLTARFVFVVVLSFSLALAFGTGSFVHADDVTGAGEELSVESVGEFVSLMTETSRNVEAAEFSVEGNPGELDGAPEAEIGTAAKFVAEQYELAQESPQSVEIIDRAHTAINDHLALCLRMERRSDKSNLAFGAVEFCQGLGTNLLHRLTLINADGETLATYTLDSFTK